MVFRSYKTGPWSSDFDISYKGLFGYLVRLKYAKFVIPHRNKSKYID